MKAASKLRLHLGRAGLATVVVCVLVVSEVNMRAILRSGGDAQPPPLPQCVVDTCTTQWDAPAGPTDVNMDFGGCAHTMHMVDMGRIKPNVTGHWCKAWLAARRCRDRRYRWMVFRDDDTKLDVPRLLELGVRQRAAVVVPMTPKLRQYITTNWFLLDTHDAAACAAVDRWWAAAQFDHPEHDQKHFNHFFRCGRDGTHCVSKYDNNLNVVHCRSKLGRIGTAARQRCMRFQIDTVPELLR